MTFAREPANHVLKDVKHLSKEVLRLRDDLKMSLLPKCHSVL